MYTTLPGSHQAFFSFFPRDRAQLSSVSSKHPYPYKVESLNLFLSLFFFPPFILELPIPFFSLLSVDLSLLFGCLFVLSSHGIFLTTVHVLFCKVISYLTCSNLCFTDFLSASAISLLLFIMNCLHSWWTKVMTFFAIQAPQRVCVGVLERSWTRICRFLF